MNCGKHIGLELALNASLVSSFSVKYKYKLSELDFLRQSLRDLKVDGEIELTVEFDVRPTIKGPFAAATRVGSGVVRAYGVVSTPSVIAAGAFAATVYFAGKSMIVLGEANYKGKEDAIGMFFSRGFASMLAKLTEPEVPDLNANLFKVTGGRVSMKGGDYTMNRDSGCARLDLDRWRKEGATINQLNEFSREADLG